MSVIVDGDLAYVNLTQGRVAIIDAEDVPKVLAWKWHARAAATKPGRKSRFYAVRTSRIDGVRRDIYLHVVIHGHPARGMVVDHKDGNTLNDTKKNLQEITKAENRRKSTATLAKVLAGGSKGVYFSKREGRYSAILHLGSFESAEEAERQYILAERMVSEAKKAAASG